MLNFNFFKNLKQDETLRFVQMPSDLTVSEGANVKLNCRSNNPQKTLYNWLKVFVF